MILLFTIVYIIACIYMLLNFKHDIQMLQQNSYRIDRFWRWLKGDISSGWRLIDLAMMFLLFSTLLNTTVISCLIALVCIGKSWYILTRKFKKPLVFTPRVLRIYTVTGIISIGIVAAEAFTLKITPDAISYYNSVQVTLGTLLLFCVLSWSIVIAAVWLLKPVEKMINRRYYNEAADILAGMPDLKIIGITGSYGKTSTKHYLERILSEKFDVLMTPGSYNTPMGVIRTIREMMKPYNEVFICEMGAKQRGDIKEICDLVHPQIGIVTAVGPMHLESFKTIENVQSTKFELIDSLPADGLAVINNDFEYCANRSVSNVTTLRYTVNGVENSDYKVEDVNYSPDGSRFTIVTPNGERMDLTTKLLGECNISNLAGAAVVALYLGVDKESIKRAVASIEQVEHRLNLHRAQGGITIIDDAFNSNPTGARMAVDVLSQFTGGQRIIVTPGMIELGDKQQELNRELGAYIGEHVDIAIIVGHYNRDALVEGVESTEFNRKNLYCVDSFQSALQLLATIQQPGATILYENDLPDTFK